MRIELAFISPRRYRFKSSAIGELVADYTARANRYLPTGSVAYETEADLLAAVDRFATRAPAALIALDSRGDRLTSEGFAGRLGRWRDTGMQHLVLAIGPPDGWSPLAFSRAALRLSLGSMTLPHELAVAVLAEQVYRAGTILAGHPYHGGHAEAAPGVLRDPK